MRIPQQNSSTLQRRLDEHTASELEAAFQAGPRTTLIIVFSVIGGIFFLWIAFAVFTEYYGLNKGHGQGQGQSGARRSSRRSRRRARQPRGQTRTQTPHSQQADEGPELETYDLDGLYGER